MAALSSTFNPNTTPLTYVTFPSTSSLSSSSSSIPPGARIEAIATATMSSSSSSDTSLNAPKIPPGKLEKRTPVETSPPLMPSSSTSTLDPMLDSESEGDWKLASKYFDENNFRGSDKYDFLNSFLKIIKLLDSILKKHPKYLPALEMRSYIHRKKLHWEVAAEFDALRILGILKERLPLLFDSKYYDEANQKVAIILRLRPGDAVAIHYQQLLHIKALEDRLKTLLDSKFYDAARATIDSILELQPDNQAAIDLLKVAIKALEADLETLFNSGSFDRAREIAKSILKLQPDNSVVKGYLGVIIKALQDRLVALFNSKSYHEAREVACSILEIQPTDAFAIYYMEELRKEKVQALQHRLVALFNSQSYAAARAVIHSILEIQPSDTLAMNYMERIRQAEIKALQDRLTHLFNSRLFDAAEEIIHRLSEVTPEYAKKYLGAICVRRGQNSQGIRILNGVLRNMPRDRFTLFYLARARYQMHSSTRDGDSQALLYLETILKMNPSDPEALELQMKILARKGNTLK